MGTYTAADKTVANSIALAQKFVPFLDGIYAANARSAILDAAPGLVNWTGANTVNVFKMTMDGLGDYSRNAGFVTGDVTGTWEDLTVTQDRGRGFLIDSMDDEESLGEAFGALAGEFIRVKVVPEVDAYRFSKIASTTGITAATPADLASITDPAGAVTAAETQLSEDEVPEEGRILFVSEGFYGILRDSITRLVTNDETGINHTIEYFDGMRVVRVPQSRFVTAITQYDGTTAGQEAGGYIPTTGGYNINFMVVDPAAVISVVKHAVPRIFAPSVNQSADAYLVQYRIYHDLFVLDNKVKGIYLHRASTAN